MAESPRLVIGCPVRKRDWVLPRWREHVLAACLRAGIGDPPFVFVVGADDDSVVQDWPNTTITTVEEEARPDKREWNGTRYHHMIEIRNQLLKSVREVRPDYFLSLDSDILLHPDAVANLLETAEAYPDAWAVGGKAYMTMENKAFPSYGMWTDGRNPDLGFQRDESADVFRADVIMAIKLMRFRGYQSDYRFHHWGEDTGWSASIALRGGQMWWDGRVTNKHVMRPDLLDTIDERIGF